MSKALWASAKATSPGATNSATPMPGSISSRPASASTKTARNSRLETSGPPIDSRPKRRNAVNCRR